MGLLAAGTPGGTHRVWSVQGWVASRGHSLPKDLAHRLHLDAGDEVFVVATDQGLLITPYDPTFAKAMAAYHRGARKYRNALRTLAE